jgi:hypothetical protein
MNITQFFLLVIERNMISNSHGIEIFYAAFEEASNKTKVLDRRQFHYAIILLAEALYKHEDNPFEAMFA